MAGKWIESMEKWWDTNSGEWLVSEWVEWMVPMSFGSVAFGMAGLKDLWLDCLKE